MRRRDASLILVIAVIVSAFSISVTIPEEASAYTPHSPILITGNAEFTASNGVTGGSGTPGDPFLIGGWEINASTATGIRIEDADVDFIVHDSWIYDGLFAGGHVGVWFENVTNGAIENVTVERCLNGILLISSHHNLVANNTVRYNRYDGLSLDLSGNNTITYNNASYNAYGFDISQISDSEISYNNASHNLAGGFTIGHLMRSDVTFNSAWHNGEHGIRISYGEKNEIYNNEVSGNNKSGIELAWSNGNRVLGNSASFNTYGIRLGGSTNVSVLNNQMVDNGIYLIGGQVQHYDTHVIDTSNTVNGRPVQYWKNTTGGTVPQGAGQVILADCSHVVVEDQNLSDGSVGLQLAYASNNIIRRNTVYSNRWAGIDTVFSHNSTFHGNEVGSNEWYGIESWYSYGNNFIDNTASGNRYGIDVLYSGSCTIDGNLVTGNTVTGISLSESHGCFITNNTVVANDLAGIRLVFSEFNYVLFNNVSLSGGIGLDISLDDYNIIHHNNILNNTQQASDITDTNLWDDGYPSGGNYWSNYTGVDICSGPNQDVCPDPDGIGDTPYIIDADSQDRYPLMSPLSLRRARAPFLLEADLSGSNWENVTLTWVLYPDDGLGLDSVIGYRIFRNSSFDPQGLGYQLHATVPKGSSEFTDSYVGEGNLTGYFYRLCAVDISGNLTCAVEQAGKYVRPLTPGPTPISAPLIQSDNDIGTCLRTLDWNEAWTYDSAIGEWKSLMQDKPYQGDLKEIHLTQGVWVNVASGSNFTTAGIVPGSFTLHLKSGWNLVGFPNFKSAYLVGDLKAQTGAKRVEDYNPMDPPYLLVSLSDGDSLSPGRAYWIWLENDSVLTLENY